MKKILFALSACFSIGLHAQTVNNDPKDVAIALNAFKTYNGQTLPRLLQSHGAVITSATPTFVRDVMSKPGDDPGDIVWDVEIHAKAPHFPCGLNQNFSDLNNRRQPISGTGDAVFEFTQRRAVMPTPWSAKQDAFAFWLSTGRCAE